MEVAGVLFDLIKDWGDIASEVPPSKRIELARDLGAQLETTHDAGLWLFATQIPYVVSFEDRKAKITATTYYLAKSTNPAIVHHGSGNPILPIRIPTPTGFTI